MRAKNYQLLLAAALASGTLLTACDKSADSFSLLPDQANFQQVAAFAPKKIDILWVVDNSGSMATSQALLATNFNSFIHRFNQYNYDFHMAVIGTDGWHRKFPSIYPTTYNKDARFRDGTGSASAHSGVFVMDKTTPNISDVFVKNIKTGISGDGDERAFESFRQALQDPFNLGQNFRRDDAFLAIIVVSDEDDFSQSADAFSESYSNPKLYPVTDFVGYLDTYTKRTANSVANYSVSAITASDATCISQLNTDGFTERKTGQRYSQLVNLTGGVKGSLCKDFGNTLQLISDSIIELSASFQLSRAPVVSSIRVLVDGVSVPMDATNGWTYDLATNTLTFHGSTVPGANSNIQILFDPATVKE